ncbi:hypothetical protein F4679DRAFT_526522 [Xylaria curta]|nr:hypothetical protein F4679DRAFT_526522 [Xylaria curta]
MTDPLSIAGTAVGVVSLGLQVYSGVKQYLDHFHARDERVSIALTYLDQLKAAVDVVDGATRSLQVQHQVPTDVVLSCLQACMAEMQKFQGKLEEFMPSHQNSSNNKLKQIRKKLEYPFQIDSIEEIEKSLRRILDQLAIAIHGLELHSHRTISSNVNALGDSMKAQTDVLSRINADSETIRKTSVANAAQLTAIGLSVQPLKPTLQALESRFEDFESQVQSTQSITNGHLNVLEYRSDANSQAMTEVLTILRHLRDQSQFTNRNFIGNHLVGSLVSKPSLLRDVNKSSDLQQEDIKPPPNSALNDPTRIALEDPRLCGCSSWRRVKQRNLRWHALDFFSTEVTVLAHRPSCSHYRGNSSQRQQTLGITYVGLRRLLSVACSVSLSLDFGAGGTSISPSFRCYNMVDENQSPPFRMIGLLSKALCYKHPLDNRRSHYHRSYDTGRIATDCISWIRVAYDRGVASPWDVSSHNSTLIDLSVELVMRFLVIQEYSDLAAPSTISALFDLGVASTQHQSLIGRLGPRSSVFDDSYLGPLSSLLLRKAPNCQYQWHITAIDLLLYRDLVHQSNEISAAVEFELDPICTALLRQDMNGLSQFLATEPKLCFERGQYKLTKSLFELAVRWPMGLNCILEMQPCFFDSDEIKVLFRKATLNTRFQCKERDRCLCSDCSCSESVKILLKHGCALTRQDIGRVFEGRMLNSMKTRHAVAQHLKLWRQKLQECLRLYLSVGPQDESTADEPNLLDHEAPHAVQTLQSIGIDPFKIFGLQQGDYRLGCSLDEPSSIYFLVRDPTTAQMVFDLGFRDIDVSYKGVTPLSVAVDKFRLSYCQWLIDKGADYTRESVWNNKERSRKPNTVNTVSNPHYSIMHGIFWRSSFGSIRTAPLKSWMASMISSSCFLLFTQTSYYDGCSCACLSSPEGCSPFSIYFNRVHEGFTIRELIDTIHTFAPSVENFSTLVESALRSLTFHRLGIRHTCCASIMGYCPVLPVDYGSDFDELREEDEYRVHQLNELVLDFMDQYNKGALTFEDFIAGPWTEHMNHIESEERKRTWTTQEKDVLLSVGVLADDELADVSGDDETETDDSLVGEDEDKLLRPEYWNRQFEIIANGGRSEEEEENNPFPLWIPNIMSMSNRRNPAGLC